MHFFLWNYRSREWYDKNFAENPVVVFTNNVPSGLAPYDLFTPPLTA